MAKNSDGGKGTTPTKGGMIGNVGKPGYSQVSGTRAGGAKGNKGGK